MSFLRSLNGPVCGVTSFRVASVPLVRCTTGGVGPVIVSANVTARRSVRLTMSAYHTTNGSSVALLGYASSCPTPVRRTGLYVVGSLTRHCKIGSNLSSRAVNDISTMITIARNTAVVRGRFVVSHDVNNPSTSFSVGRRRFTRVIGSVHVTRTTVNSMSCRLASGVGSKERFSHSLCMTRSVGTKRIVARRGIHSIHPNFNLRPGCLGSVLKGGMGRSLRGKAEFT